MNRFLGLIVAAVLAVVPARAEYISVTPSGGGSFGSICPLAGNTQILYDNAGVCGSVTGATTDGTKLTLVAPILGTPTSGTATNLTGLPISTGLAGAGTGVLTALGVNIGTAGSFVVNGGALGIPSSGTLTSVTGLPISTGLTGAGTGVLTALGVNVGSAGAFVVLNGALGTPSSGTLTSATGLPISTGLTGAGTGVLTALGVNVGSAGAFITFNGAGGTPSSLIGTNISGTAAGLTAGNVTTNANLTGPITSVGNATSIASQTGTGTTFVMSASPIFTGVVQFPDGTAAAPSLNFTGQTTTGFYSLSSTFIGVSMAGQKNVSFGTSGSAANGSVAVSSGGSFSWGTTTAEDGAKTIVTSPATASFQYGAVDAAVAVAQTTRVQSVVAGTAAANGANWTLIGSLPTGTGTSGDIIFQTGVKTGSGTTQGTATTALTIKGETQALVTSALDSASSTGGALQVAGGASVAKRFWIPAITASAGLQTAVLCQSSGGEMIADSVACLASGSQFKTIFGPMEDGALGKLMKLPMDRWAYKAEGNFKSDDWTRERIGPIAQDVAAMDKRLAGYDNEGNIRTFSTEQLLAFTIKAVQELNAKVDARW